MVDSIVAGGARARDPRAARSALDRGQELEEQARGSAAGRRRRPRRGRRRAPRRSSPRRRPGWRWRPGARGWRAAWPAPRRRRRRWRASSGWPGPGRRRPGRRPRPARPRSRLGRLGSSPARRRTGRGPWPGRSSGTNDLGLGGRRWRGPWRGGRADRTPVRRGRRRDLVVAGQQRDGCGRRSSAGGGGWACGHGAGRRACRRSRRDRARRAPSPPARSAARRGRARRPMRRTVAPPPTATRVVQRAWSTVTSSLGRRRPERHPRVHRRHDGLDGPPLVEEGLGLGEQDLDVGRRRRVVVGGLGVEGEGALLEAQQLEERVDRLVGVGRVGGLDRRRSRRSTTQTLPVPRPPVIRSRPVFFVAARRRSTSGRANVSRVPCRATLTSGDEWAVVPIGTSGRGLQWILEAPERVRTALGGPGRPPRRRSWPRAAAPRWSRAGRRGRPGGSASPGR